MTSEATTALASALASIAPDGVSTAVRRIDAGDVRLLFPSERLHVQGAVARRRTEFATGRALLRRLLDHDAEILTAPNGSPVAPVGTTVTLAHDRSHAVAASTRRRSVEGLGIDIEPHGAVDPATASTVCLPEERHLDPTLVFVIKEASYKAWSSRGGPMLEFDDMRVDVNGSSTFTSLATVSSFPIAGSYATAAGHWLALAWIGHP
jgi:4'-phosphopantetheinyl transferase EntD